MNFNSIYSESTSDAGGEGYTDEEYEDNIMKVE